jgi:beta-fructofuranosidase
MKHSLGITSIVWMMFLLGLVIPLLSYGQETEGQNVNQSKGPQFTYPTNLKDQKEALKDNPLMERFVESRKSFSNDPYRPNYHFVSPEGNLNDPNGLCYWEGRWHLFYQAYPPEDPRQHWGHAVSKDLIHWKDLPYAIYPGPERRCYSGSAYVEDGRVIAMYHGRAIGNMVATSDDPLLLNWDKVSGEPVIPLESPSGFPLPYPVYDPNIWKKDGVYYSLSGGRVRNGPEGNPVAQAYLFRSRDLEHWQYMHPFVEGDRFTLIGDDFACPYFWPIGDRHILPFYSHMSGGQYLLGDYDKKRNKFKATGHGYFNFGASAPSGVHAPSAFPDGEDVIIIFNMNPGFPTEGWNQIMTLPRRLSLNDADQLEIEPAGDIQSLRYDHQQVGSMKLPANEEVVLDNIKGKSMEVRALIDPKEAQMIEVSVLRSTNRQEHTTIAVFPYRGYGSGRGYSADRKSSEEWWHRPKQSLITLRTSHSSILPEARSRAPETAPVILQQNEKIELRVFIDKSVVEVFINGRQCVAARVYPGLENSRGVSLRAQGSEGELVSLDAWQMKNIYHE